MRRGFVRRTVLVAASAVLFFAAPSAPVHAASTLSVPGSFATIQAAIDAAADGDTVLVGPGTYMEQIDFKGKAITVKSTQGPSGTVIDGSNAEHVVTFSNGETRASVLQGFTIQHGMATSGMGVDGYSGGGIAIAGASPTIRGNVVTGNVAGADGAGIDVSFGSPLITGNTITGNTEAPGWSGGGGGGISVGGAAAAEVTGNVITHNHSFWAGAIMLFAAGSPIITDNVMNDNSADSDGGGMWIVNQSDALIAQNVITNNISPTLGGGIFYGTPSGTRGPYLVNNTFSGNSASEGSALYIQGFAGQSKLFNNLLQGAGASSVDCDTSTSDGPTLDHNDVVGGLTGTCSSMLGTNGNISADPRFVGGGNFRLQAGSPGVDAGNGAAPSLPATDLDGLPRVSGAGVDMGAYELQQGSDPANVGASPASVDFGSTQAGAAASASVTLTNTGGAPAHIDGVTIGAGAPAFGVGADGCTGATLNPGANCVIAVRFSPSGPGAVTGRLDATGSAGTVSVPLSGTGVSGLVSVQPASLTFGRVRVGRQSAASTVTVMNGGNATLHVGAISIQGQNPGDFVIASSSCAGAALAPGATCSVAVRFKPAASGARTATLTVASDAPGSPPTVALSGTGH